MRLTISRVIASLFLAAILAVPVWGTTTNPSTALPGTLNYVEGNATMGSQIVDLKSIGSAELPAGQSLQTQNGKVEVLLTPGVFLRVGNNSSVEMVSPSLTNTEVGIDQGHAMVEVAEIHPENDIRIDADGTTTKLLKTGLYDFNLNQNELRVFDGKALVENSAQHVTLKGGREVALSADASLNVEKFDKKTYEEDDLYRWSSLRSAYLAEANVNAAAVYAGSGWGRGVPAGGAQVGIGIRGLALSLSFREMESSTARLVGDSIRQGWFIRLPSTDMDMEGTTAISAATFIPGDQVPTMWQEAHTRMVFTVGLDQQGAADFTLDRG